MDTRKVKEMGSFVQPTAPGMEVSRIAGTKPGSICSKARVLSPGSAGSAVPLGLS